MTKIDAEVTIKFVIENVCDMEDIDPDCDDFESIVQDRIMDEGLYNLLESDLMLEDYEVIDIKKIH